MSHLDLNRKFKSAVVRLRRFLVSARFGASPDMVYGDGFYEGGGFSKTDETAKAITSYIFKRYR